jgi:hypothetical protein
VSRRWRLGRGVLFGHHLRQLRRDASFAESVPAHDILNLASLRCASIRLALAHLASLSRHPFSRSSLLLRGQRTRRQSWMRSKRVGDDPSDHAVRHSPRGFQLPFRDPKQPRFTRKRRSLS